MNIQRHILISSQLDSLSYAQGVSFHQQTKACTKFIVTTQSCDIDIIGLSQYIWVVSQTVSWHKPFLHISSSIHFNSIDPIQFNKLKSILFNSSQLNSIQFSLTQLSSIHFYSTHLNSNQINQFNSSQFNDT